MSTAVFPIDPAYTLGHSISFINYVADMGDGFEQRINKNIAYSRADGQGSVTSYKGRNKFNVNLTKMKHINADSTQRANKLWNFYIARLGGFEAFYFYNPIEAVIDLTGTASVGRYLVRFMEQELSREAFILRLFNAGLVLLEVRS